MLFALFVLPLVLGSAPSKHIIGGDDVEDPERHPWQGSLLYNGGHRCGCVLLTPEYVLTAAHCTNGKEEEPELFQMRFNSVMWESGGDVHNVSLITQHPDFADGSGGVVPHDVCVLTSATTITGTAVSLDVTESESDCWITGWGEDEIDSGQNDPAPQLQEANIEIMSNEDCATFWELGFRADVHICITSPNLDKGACNGDSGGPLVCNHGTSPELRGVTSYGRESCDTSYPAVYARIYNSAGEGSNLKPWICETAPGSMGC